MAYEGASSPGPRALTKGSRRASFFPAAGHVKVANDAAHRRDRPAALEHPVRPPQQSVGAVREIGITIEKLQEISSTIASAVEQQGAVTQDISRNVQHAAAGTQLVSANIADVQRGAVDAGTAASQVLSAGY